jgi:hypothetical protein
VLVFDMGEPVRIADVARQLVAQATQPVEIVYTGLRAGEKLHEDRLGAGEVDLRPHHPLISQVTVPAIACEWETALELDGHSGDIVSWLEHWSRAELLEWNDGCHSIASASSTTSATRTATDTVLR